jgi:microcystin-dependent protein
MGQGPGLSPYAQGQQSGTESVTLTAQQMPAHTHAVAATVAVNTQPGTGISPQNAFLAVGPGAQYSESRGASGQVMAANLVTGTAGPTGSGQGHSNVMPYLTLNYCIALSGVFPQRP